MVEYRLTTRGKAVIVLLSTFMILCLLLNFAYKNNQDSRYYDYSEISENGQHITVDEPEPAQEEEVNKELLETLKVAVLFEANKTQLNAEYHESLDKFIDAAQKYDNMKIQVEGNCATLFPNDPKQKSINNKISLLRAQAVADYIKSKGISAERLIVIGNGSDKPLKDNSSPEGRKFNRRVDVFFVSEQ